MKRLFILLTVCILLLAGCSGQREQPITENQSVEATSQVEENEDLDIAEAESTEENVQAEAEESKKEPEHTTEPEKSQQDAEQSKREETTPSQEEKPEQTATTEAPTPATKEPESPKEQPAEAPTEAKAAEYNPNEVVSLATEKTKAYGKISIPEDLDNMLANGEITKEEYDEYYPYDGAGYYSVFVEMDLNQAATTSGRKLGSVGGIASYIAEMLSLETDPYFYIEYAGVHSINGTDFYEFRCYRA